MPSQPNLPLADGYQLLDYRIERPLSSGGFSIVYLATAADGNPVAIKEYLPSNLVVRTEGATVETKSPENLIRFRHGLKCFFEEGRALAKISHPNVVRVENFFRANDTVYMVMQYVRGRTLQFHVKTNRKQLTEAFIRRFFSTLLNGLREVHTHKLLHLDIKPANIYVNMEGVPILLDFGAARRGLAGDGPQLKPMYTQGFAAPELYTQDGRMGPWTDIYSVGATLFACLTGSPPQAADARTQEDKLESAHKLLGNRYSPELLDIIDWCLRIDPLARPQSVFALQKALKQYPFENSQKPSFFAALRDKLKVSGG